MVVQKKKKKKRLEVLAYLMQKLFNLQIIVAFQVMKMIQ